MYALDHRSNQNQSRSIRTALRRRSIPHCLRVFSQPCSSQPQRNNRQEKTSNNRKLWNKIWHINSWQSCQTVRLSLTFIVYCWNVLLAFAEWIMMSFPQHPSHSAPWHVIYPCCHMRAQEHFSRRESNAQQKNEWLNVNEKCFLPGVSWDDSLGCFLFRSQSMAVSVFSCTACLVRSPNKRWQRKLIWNSHLTQYSVLPGIHPQAAGQAWFYLIHGTS